MFLKYSRGTGDKYSLCLSDYPDWVEGSLKDAGFGYVFSEGQEDDTDDNWSVEFYENESSGQWLVLLREGAQITYFLAEDGVALFELRRYLAPILSAKVAGGLSLLVGCVKRAFRHRYHQPDEPCPGCESRTEQHRREMWETRKR